MVQIMKTQIELKQTISKINNQLEKWKKRMNMKKGTNNLPKILKTPRKNTNQKQKITQINTYPNKKSDKIKMKSKFKKRTKINHRKNN